MEGKFDAYILRPLAKRVKNWIVDRSITHDFMIPILHKATPSGPPSLEKVKFFQRKWTQQHDRISTFLTDLVILDRFQQIEDRNKKSLFLFNAYNV